MAGKRDPRLSLEQSSRISSARMLGQGAGRAVYLEDDTLVRLIAHIERDLARNFLLQGLTSCARNVKPYFEMDLAEFEIPMEGVDFPGVYVEASAKIQDFETIFECLCEIHKRRVKISRIMSSQPFPDISQIAPRALLEYGMIIPKGQATWMVWRKWLYDIDNRIAQETGYLFEPILARALGGRSYDAKTSPVRREDNPERGRQVDCVADRLAYEFKVRLTDAPSGRGRLNEEHSFPADCVASGYVPVLLVLQSDSSERVRKLAEDYRRCGGGAYVGEEAWVYLRERSSETMVNFMESYVRRITDDVVTGYDRLGDLTLRLRDGLLEIQVEDENGLTRSMEILRSDS